MLTRIFRTTGIVWLERFVIATMLALVLHGVSASFRSLCGTLVTSIGTVLSLRLAWFLANVAVVTALLWVRNHPFTASSA